MARWVVLVVLAYLLQILMVMSFLPHGRSKHIQERSQLSTSDADEGHDADNPIIAETRSPTLQLHHVAIRTQNITRAISFYSMLLSVGSNQKEDCGLTVTKFKAGPARAAWLEASAHARLVRSSYRLELIEVPRWILEEMPTGTLFRAPDLIAQNSILGYNHVALEISIPLENFIQRLQKVSFDRFKRTVRVAVHPYTQIIGKAVYELAFVYDADGSLIELLHLQSLREGRPLTMDPWEPWDGTGFRGQGEPVMSKTM